MQPDNSAQNTVPEGQKLETVVKEVTEMETRPVAAEPPKNDIVFNDEAKKSNGMLIGLILCLILAIGGIGFGVWAMMDGNNQKEQLNSQISTLKGQVNELQEKLSGSTGGDDIIKIDTDTNDLDAANYIYVGEWGIKIKRPENWRNIVREYSFSNGYPMAVDSLEIRESVNAGDGVTIYLGGESCEAQAASANGTCFVVGDNVIIVTELVGELAPGAASEMSEEFRAHFMNSENYSEI